MGLVGLVGLGDTKLNLERFGESTARFARDHKGSVNCVLRASQPGIATTLRAVTGPGKGRRPCQCTV
jgi:hypothetical protein